LKRESELYFQDIVKAVDRIKGYVHRMNFDTFSKNELVMDAVLRNLEIIGEAATQLPKEAKDKAMEIPWRDIQDFRIVAAHHYWKINLNRVWDIIENKLDPLKKQILQLKNK